MIRELHLRAFAKINLDLRVLHKRIDGYHEIRTVFQTISLADEIEMRYDDAAETGLTVDCDVPVEGQNLVERAAHLVVAELKPLGSLHFRIRKRIPIGAGLGGGSSDAAAVLLALPHLLSRPGELTCPIDDAKRLEWARELGSDVPFLLRGGAAIGAGRGDELYPLEDQPPRWGLLVIPGIHVTTAAAYRSLNAPFTSHDAAQRKAAFERYVWERDDRLAQNDFEHAVFAQHPELSGIKSALNRVGANPALMTGSGSALFGLFPNREAAEAARPHFAGYRTEVFRFVSRAEFQAEWREH